MVVVGALQGGGDEGVSDGCAVDGAVPQGVGEVGQRGGGGSVEEGEEAVQASAAPVGGACQGLTVDEGAHQALAPGKVSAEAAQQSMSCRGGQIAL